MTVIQTITGELTDTDASGSATTRQNENVVTVVVTAGGGTVTAIPGENRESKGLKGFTSGVYQR